MSRQHVLGRARIGSSPDNRVISALAQFIVTGQRCAESLDTVCLLVPANLFPRRGSPAIDDIGFILSVDDVAVWREPGPTPSIANRFQRYHSLVAFRIEHDDAVGRDASRNDPSVVW